MPENIAAGANRSPPAPAPDLDGRTRDRLLIALTFAAGLVDAVSYLGLGSIFTANMTGNLVFLGLAVGHGNLLTAAHSIDALVGFSVGAVVAGHVLGRDKPGGVWPARVTWVVSGELACVAAFAGVWFLLLGHPSGAALYGLIAGLSVGMGAQNAVARHLAVPGLTTTVITRTLTGFMVDLPALGISGSEQRRALAAVLALFSGGGVGAALLLRSGADVRALAPFVIVATMLFVVVVARRHFAVGHRAV